MENKLIREAYKNYWLENGKKPVSVYIFCQQLGLSESVFYDAYSSFDAVEKDIWLSFFTETVDKLKADPTYLAYNSREKLLSFYFLWVQKLKEDRSYILQQKEQLHIPGYHADRMEKFKDAFYEYARELILEGYQTGEVKERKYISSQYVHGFWVQALFVLNYWVKDDSEKFELTDAAIEKAVNLSFQLIGSGTLDSILDFGKFMFTKK